MNTVSGTTVVSIGAGGTIYNGQLVNGASIGAAGYGNLRNCLQLNSSSSQYVQVPSFATGNAGFTFACWFRSNSNANYARIFDFGNGDSSDNIVAEVYSDSLVFAVYLSSQYQAYTAYNSVNDNVWRHFVWTLSSSGTWTAYVNGVYVTSSTGLYYPNAITRTSNYLGRSNMANQPYYTGGIDEFNAYAMVLGASDVLALANSGENYITIVLFRSFMLSLCT